MIRKVGLFAVMIGALALSFNGQVQSVRALVGMALAVVFALTFDIASLLALHEVTSTIRAAIRRWAWSVLLLAGGTALGLNTWHALSSRTLPWPVAVAVGAGPVVLAWLLSHLITLVLSDQREAATGSASYGPSAATHDRWDNALAELVHRDRPGPLPTGSVGGQPDQAPHAQPPRASNSGDASNGHAPNATEEFARLVDQAERLERQARADSGGKRGISYREATRRLRVRFDTAREAVNAARARIDGDGFTDAA